MNIKIKTFLILTGLGPITKMCRVSLVSKTMFFKIDSGGVTILNPLKGQFLKQFGYRKHWFTTDILVSTVKYKSNKGISL